MTVLLSVAVLLAAGLPLAGFVAWCVHMPGKNPASELPPPDRDQRQQAERLHRHVDVLAEDIGERHYNRMPALDRAADYIEEQLRVMGYVPEVRRFGDDMRYRNISVEVHGTDKPGEVIVVGAHYDTTWMTSGADDNASGVAGLLELARALRGQRLRRTLRLVFFANEEEPFYGGEEMGSRVSARRARDRGEDIRAMFSLEMIGYYSSAPGSQRYPGAIRRFYPERGDFIAFVSNIYSGPVMRRAVARFREQKIFPAEGMAAPEWLVPDIRRSDNASYWDFGFPAVMVTDTANYRNRNYHNVGDTARTLDYVAMARVVTGLAGMLRSLAADQGGLPAAALRK